MKDGKLLLGTGAVVGGGTALWYFLRRKRPAATVNTTGWVWPIAALPDRNPEISDGFASPRPGYPGGTHLGVDVMYPRKTRGELADKYPPGSPNGSTWNFVPDKTHALAVAKGIVTRAGQQPRGMAVTIKHDQAATFYTHMESLLVKVGDLVSAGQPIGIVGADPLDGEHLKHLHFELWPAGTEASVIDPAPLMKKWAVIPPEAPPQQRVS